MQRGKQARRYSIATAFRRTGGGVPYRKTTSEICKSHLLRTLLSQKFLTPDCRHELDKRSLTRIGRAIVDGGKQCHIETVRYTGPGGGNAGEGERESRQPLGDVPWEQPAERSVFLQDQCRGNRWTGVHFD